jgi:outer membrane protein assembly factor BamB
MKRLAAIVVIGLAVASASGQYTRVWTQPAIPPADVLDRLNLRLGWQAAAPVFGFHDGVATIQDLGDVIIVQTRRGGVIAIDPVTGAARWQTSVGNAYPVVHKVGTNDSLILVANGTRVFALDRATGRTLWDVDLSGTPSSPPSANADAFYICLSNGRLSAYAFPVETPPATSNAPSTAPAASRPPEPARPGSSGTAAAAGSGVVRTQPVPARPSASQRVAAPTASGAPAGGSGRTANTSIGTGIRSATTAMQVSGGRSATTASEVNRTGRGGGGAGGPRLLWDYQTNLRISERPALGTKHVLVVGTGREALFIDKDGSSPVPFTADAPFSSPIAQYGTIAYAACTNGTIYAFDLPNRSVLWSVTAHGAVFDRPIALDEDLFVTSERGGVTRFVRTNGQLLWQNPAAVKFLASNPKFVYARDSLGNLMILDRARGTTLTTYDLREFTSGLINTESDRVILGADSGLLVSLHDRAYPQPLRLRNPAPPPPPTTDSAIEEKPVPLFPKPAAKLAPPPGEKPPEAGRIPPPPGEKPPPAGSTPPAPPAENPPTETPKTPPPPKPPAGE